MVDESAQFWQDLKLAWVVEKKARRCNGEGGQHGLQSTLFNMRFDGRAGYLCKSQTLDCRSDKCRIIVCDQRTRDDGFDGLVAIDKRPGSNRTVRAAHAQAGMAA